MKFDITNKLKANENPVLIAGENEYTVKTDAATVLQAFELASGHFSVDKMQEAVTLLFSEEDQKKLGTECMENWMAIVESAVTVAMTGKVDVDEEAPTEAAVIPVTT